MTGELVLGIDPGAARLGWCLLEKTDEYKHLSHGILGVKFNITEPWNLYRKQLIEYWMVEWPKLMSEVNPDRIVSERLPVGASAAVGGNTQRISGVIAVSLCQLMNAQRETPIPWEEISAITIKNSFFNKEERKEKNYRSKIRLRDRICGDIWPEFWATRTKLLADETDSMGIALYGAGYRHADG